MAHVVGVVDSRQWKTRPGNFDNLCAWGRPDAGRGFEIARRDLEMRGPGEILGVRQTGMAQFRIADVMRDQGLLPDVQRVAKTLLEKYPDHADAIIRRWLVEREEYAQV